MYTFVLTAQSGCAVPRMRRWCPADRVECLFPSTTGGTALHTHGHTNTHMQSRCMHTDAHPFTNIHSRSDNAPIIGWTEGWGGGQKEGHRLGAVSAFSPILTFHLDTLECKHFIM